MQGQVPGTKSGRLLLIGGVTLAAIIAIAFVPRVPQDEAYHNLADQRWVFGGATNACVAAP